MGSEDGWNGGGSLVLIDLLICHFFRRASCQDCSSLSGSYIDVEDTPAKNTCRICRRPILF